MMDRVTVCLVGFLLIHLADPVQSRLQFMGRSLSFDWHFLSHILPPFRETLDLSPQIAKDQPDRISLQFLAFGKRWYAELFRNTMLFTKKSTIAERAINGSFRRDYVVDTSCYYIGTARGGASEFGMMSFSTCNGQINGLIISNINDYVVYENGWKKHRLSRSTDSFHSLRLKLKRVDAENQPDLYGLNKFLRKRRNVALKSDIPKFKKMDLPTGRNLYVEYGIIVDKHYIKDYTESISGDRNDLIHHIILSLNNAQLWYLHPTLGFQIWMIIRDIVLVDDDLPIVRDESTASNPAALCKWTKTVFPNEKFWDEILIFSSKPDIWHGRVGLAQRSGVCSEGGIDRCAGVSHVNFQMASLARLIAHELMHPLGVGDDYEGRTASLCFSGIMRRGVWQDHDWSTCSVQEFERWAGTTANKCVTRSQTSSLTADFTRPRLPVNIAWRTHAIQSSTYKSEKEWGAWKATDGPLTGLPENKDAVYGSCTHTLRENQPWIRIDLEAVHSSVPIDVVIVYNRDDCCSDRLRDFEVRIGNNTDFRKNPLCAYHRNGVSGGRNGAAVLTCSEPLSGKYVSLQLLSDNSILTVCEIQVMASVDTMDFNLYDNQCRDHNSYCPFWGRVGGCSKKEQWQFMAESCPLTCGICTQPSDAPVHQKINEETILPVTSSPSETCKDSHESCLHYAANGDCDIDNEMKKRCPRSCGVCNTTIIQQQKTTSLKTTNEDSSYFTKPTTNNPVKPAGNQNLSEYAYLTTGGRRSSVYESTSSKPLTKHIISKERPTPPLLQVTKSSNDEPFEDSSGNLFETDDQNTVPSQAETNEIAILIKDDLFGTKQIATDEICFDENTNCDVWVTKGYCTASSMVANLCLKSCGICPLGVKNGHNKDENCMEKQEYCQLLVPSDCINQTVTKECPNLCGGCRHTQEAVTEYETVVSTATTTVATAQSQLNHVRTNSVGNCYDTRRECASWEKIGHCSVKTVQRMCPIACKLCSPKSDETVDPECVDSSASCFTWAKFGHCRKKSVSALCRASCNIC